MTHMVKSSFQLLMSSPSGMNSLMAPKTGLILKMGRDLERELTLLEQVRWHSPETAVLVVGDVDNLPLADLGARCVLFPPLPRTLLPDIVAGFMAGTEA